MVFVPSHILAAFIYVGGVTLVGGVTGGAEVVGRSIPGATGASGACGGRGGKRSNENLLLKLRGAQIYANWETFEA